MSGTLPFIEDSTGEKFKRQKYKEQSFVELKERGSRDTKEHTPTTALSYDEVNDDLDELVALRGEGRYFGVTDPDDESGISRQSLGPLCANCHKRGHTRAKCTVVICHKCGAIDDHYESQCPTTIICSRCGEKGHIVLQCKSKIRKRQYCRTCDSFKHGDENCPSIWRSYITKLPSQGENEESSVLPRIYCYNCASNEHFGDECDKPRSSRIPNFGSAFSGNNLPKKYRNLYFKRLRAASNSRIGDEEYRPTTSTRDYTSNFTPSSRYEGFGSQGFSRNGGDHPSRSGFFPKRQSSGFGSSNGFLRTPKGPSQDNRSKGKFNLNAYGSKSSYNQPTRTGMINQNGSQDQRGIYRNSTRGGPQPTRSGLIGNRKSKNFKKMKY